MLQVIDSVTRWRGERARLAGREIGFVPTMGALHDGHAALLERSLEENDVTVLSVFVNPTQFDQDGDLARYPRTFGADRRLAENLGAEYLLCPSYAELYPDGYAYRVSESPFSRELEGAHRDGHFDGVLTVVLKLLNLTRPRRAYFGEKDFQQLELVRGMAGAFFLDVEIVACPTVRESDGLALSSRNRLLAPADRERAGAFPRLLASRARPDEIVRRLEDEGFRVDYVEDVRGRRCGAVHLGEVRLIDNFELTAVNGGCP